MWELGRRWLRRIGRGLSPLPILRSVDAYSIWAKLYPARPHNAFMALEQEVVLDLLPALDGRRVLDLACGSGRYAQIAIARGAAQVIGVDHSLSMLREASGFPRLHADMTALPLRAATIDVVVCGLAIGHLSPLRMPRALVEVARVLAPGGTIVFSDFHPYAYLEGARRSFAGPDGRTYQVEHHPHLVADYFRALQAAGLTLSALRETAATPGGRAPAILAIAARRV
jgi:SAM-dependent methyltransferase